MKNSPLDSPRLVCRLVRGSLAILGDTSAAGPRGPGAGHVAGCEDCQSFFGAGDELTHALKRDAAREWHDAPAGLEQSIMQAVTRAVRQETKPVARASRTLWVSLAGAGAAAVVAVLVYQQTSFSVGASASGSGAMAAAGIDSDAAAMTRLVVNAVPADFLAQVQPKAEELLQANPLKLEADAIASDARKAVGFLARNFLPTPAALPARGE